MKWSARELMPNDMLLLQGLEQRKTDIAKMLGLIWKPPFFEKGDRVCFIYGVHDKDFGFGKIIDDDGLGVEVLSDEGKEYRVSPFALIKL